MPENPRNRSVRPTRRSRNAVHVAGGVAGLSLLALLAAPAASAAAAPCTVYSGGAILTMAGDEPDYVEAVTVCDGRIVSASTLAEAEARAGAAARHVDLAGRVMLPGFIDAHGHVSAVGRSQAMVDLAPPPLGRIMSISALQDALRVALAAPHGKVLLGNGYDDAALIEKRHPTRADLDAVSATVPIALMHVSGHLVVVNSAMLKLLGIGASTADPVGGRIVREAGTTTPNGVLEEAAAQLVLPYSFPGDAKSFVDAIKAGTRLYARNGLTTAQDGALFPAQWEGVLMAMREPLPIDVVGLLYASPEWPKSATDLVGKGYTGNIRIAGMKFVLDGSPQGRTAFLSQPYFHAPHSEGADYHGYPAMDPALFDKRMEQAARNGWQVFAHVNGDAAMQAYLDAVERHHLAGKRSIAIHAQVVRPDQLDRMARLDVQPSFFASHTYYWGDWHREVVLGPRRADFISPQASAWAAGLRPTAHNDSPVVPPDMIRLIWSSVTRRTRSGDILGPAERIPPYRALQEVTINAAWQIHEEAQKGSIAVGKQADFVILDADPNKVDPEKIIDIKVVGTINDGRLIFGAL